MPHRYLVGVDESPPSDAALAWALARAGRDPAPVVLVHVADVDWGNMGTRYRDDAIATADRVLDRLLAAARARHPGHDLTGVRLEGSPPWALARYARPDDLLVIGTHKTGYLQGRVLGSGSVQVVAAAPCTVAVIPDVGGRYRRGVVAGIDREDTAEALAVAAAREAHDRRDDLALIHAAERESPGAAAGALAVARAAVRATWPDIATRSRTSTRRPAEALLDAARGKALLVIGPGSLDRTRSPIRSVVHDVLMNANTPVLVIHGNAWTRPSRPGGSTS